MYTLGSVEQPIVVEEDEYTKTSVCVVWLADDTDEVVSGDEDVNSAISVESIVWPSPDTASDVYTDGVLSFGSEKN